MSEVVVKNEPTSPKSPGELQRNLSWGRGKSPGSPKSQGSFEGRRQPVGGKHTSDLGFSIPPGITVNEKLKMIKSEFMRSQLLAQKKHKTERIRQMSDQEYLSSEFYESKLKSIMEDDEEQYPSQLREAQPVILTGAHSFVKKKFCGSTVVTEYVDIRISRDKEISVAQSQIYGGANKIPQAELDNIKSLVPKELLDIETMPVRRVAEVIQEASISKVGGKSQDQLKSLFLPQGSKFEYVVPGPVTNQSKLDIFVRDKQQLTDTSKAIIQNPVYSSRYMSQFGAGKKVDIPLLVSVWKARIAEGFLTQVEKHQGVPEPQPVLAIKQTNNLPSFRRVIRLGALRKVLTDITKKQKVLVLQQMGALRNYFTLREIQENTSRLKVGLDILRQFARSRKPRPPVGVPMVAKEVQLQVNPVKLFLVPYTKPNVNSQVKDLLERLTNPDFQTIDELEIFISDTDLSPQELDLHYRTDNWFKVDKTPHPYSADLPVREYQLSMKQRHIDLGKFTGQFLIVALKNLDGGKVWATGSCVIYSDFGHRNVIELLDKRGTKVGIFVFRNSQVALQPDIDSPLVRKQVAFVQEILRPENLGVLRRLDSVWACDRGLSAITGVSSLKDEFETLKLKFLTKIYQKADLIEFEEYQLREKEWDDFETFFKESADYARQVNQRHVPDTNTERTQTIQPVPAQSTTLAPARQHSLRRGVSEYQPRLPADQFVLERTEFRQRADALGLKIPQLIDTDSSLYLYNCLIPWELTLKNKGHLDVLERALGIGIPTKSLLRVWKSVGKTMLSAMIVQDICAEMLPGYEPGRPLITQLAATYSSDYPDVSQSLIAAIDQLANPSIPEERRILLKVISAYCNLGHLMRLLNNRFVNKGPLRQALAGFNLLEPTVATVHLLRHLIRVSTLTHGSQGTNLNDAIEQDVFWLFVTLAFVVMPEQFLQVEPAIQELLAPKSAEESDQATAERQTSIMSYIIKVDNMGASLGKLIKKKSSGLALAGTPKVAALFAQLVYKELPAVYYAMAELGFPFTTFAAETIDSLFCQCLNFDTLNKLWSVLFFEGASSQKRRAQQVMLSALVAQIHSVKRAVLESKSVQEMMLCIRATALDLSSIEFIQRVRCIQRKHFLSAQSNVTLISELGKIIKGNKSMEETWASIREEVLARFVPVREFFNEFRTQIGAFIDLAKKEHKGQHIDTKQLDLISSTLTVQQSMNNGGQLLVFTNYEKSHQNAELISKKGIFHELQFSLCSWDFGEYLPRGSVITAESPMLRNSIRMEVDQRGWYSMYSVPVMAGHTVDMIQLVISLKLTSFTGKFLEARESVNLADFEFNQDCYFQVRCGSATFVFFVRLAAPQTNVKAKGYLDTLHFDPQLRQHLFADSLATQLKIQKSHTFESELIHSEINDVVVMENMLNHFFRIEEGKFTDKFKKSLSQNLLSSMKINLFEFLTTLIVSSPRTRQSAVKNLFDILNKLDQSYRSGRVKVSHVGFLIWYLHRLSGVLQPLHEINRQIQKLLSVSEAHILNAVITPLDTGTSSLDITELLNIWISMERKRTGRSVLVLGQGGFLQNLKEAVQFWQQETGMQPHTFGQNNRLRIIVQSSSGHTNTLEYSFDNLMRVVFPHKHLDIPVETDQVVLLDDAATTVDMQQFINLLDAMRLEPIWGRLGVGELLVAKREVEAQDIYQSAFKDNNIRKLPPVKLEYYWSDSNSGKLASVMFSTESNQQTGLATEQGPAKYHTKLDYYNSNQASITTPGHPLGEVRARLDTDQISFLTLVKKGIRLALESYLSQLDTQSCKSQFSSEIMQLQHSSKFRFTLLRNEKVLSPMEANSSLMTYFKTENIQAASTFTVRVENEPDIDRSSFDRLAKNIYDLEGVAVVDNPLTPCRLVAEEGLYSSVVFFGTGGTIVRVPTDQVL